MFSEGQKKQVIILGVLLLVLAVIALRKTVFSGSRADVVLSDDDGTEVSDTPVLASSLKWQPPEPIPDNLRDPMILTLSGSPSGESETNQPIRIVTQHDVSKGDLVQIEGTSFYLKGIVYSEINPSSIITNEGLLHEGDVIHGIQVVKIARNNVEFQKNEHTYHVRVGEKTSDRESDPNQ